MRSRSLLLLGALAGFATACEDDDVQARYSATLSGSNEVPTNTSPATGTFTAELSDDNILTYRVEFTGMQSNLTLGHIHGPAAAGVNAGILVDFNQPSLGRVLDVGATAGDGAGTFDLSLVTNNPNVDGDSLLVLLNNGNAYVNLHTVNRGGGEIRGQIIRQ
jgi:hypothetical protein